MHECIHALSWQLEYWITSKLCFSWRRLILLLSTALIAWICFSRNRRISLRFFSLHSGMPTLLSLHCFVVLFCFVCNNSHLFHIQDTLSYCRHHGTLPLSNISVSVPRNPCAIVVRIVLLICQLGMGTLISSSLQFVLMLTSTMVFISFKKKFLWWGMSVICICGYSNYLKCS